MPEIKQDTAMTDLHARSATAFAGTHLLIAGPLTEVALAVRTAAERVSEPILTFDDATGAVIDLDLRGSEADVTARLERQPVAATPDSPTETTADAAPEASRGRGRPRLGVIGREVTLLPRHWEWLATQPGGASVALRRLVDEARRNGAHAQQTRTAQERAYRFMSAMAGDLPWFEEATRALFAGDPVRFAEQMVDWPADIRAYALRLAALTRQT